MSDLPIKTGRVRVTARSSVHDTTAETADVRGTARLRADGERLYLDALRVEVDLATLRTGDTLKDLELKRRLGDRTGGRAVFEARGPAEVAAGKARLGGTLTFRGISRPLDVAPEVSADGAGARGRAAFRVRFTDHGLEAPKVLFLKMQEEVDVVVELTA